MDPASFLSGRSRETTIRRDAQGRWYHDGDLLEHGGLTRAFDGWIERAEDGRYCLRNEINWAYIQLEGPPYFVRSLRFEAGTVWLKLSSDQERPLRTETLREGPEGALYCELDGRLVARFDSHAQMQLSEHLEEDDDGPYLVLGGKQIRPPQVAQPLPGIPDAPEGAGT